jgi:integrase
MSPHSTPRRRSRKANRPKKPYPDFPLTPHASGAWMKKIRGRIHYFGRWARRVGGKLERVEGDGWKDALELYKAQADDLHAGRTPRTTADALTVVQLCDRFLVAKERKQAAGELGPRMFQEYHEIADLIVDTFGRTRTVDSLRAEDFEELRARMAERWGPVRLGNAITRVKGVFKYGLENGLIDRTIRYGSEFKRPGRSVLRRHRAKHPPRMLEAEQVRQLLDAAPVQLKAMILLGVNCGLGNHDVAALPRSALNLDRGWLDYARAKTGIPRRCPLWPETVQAIRAVLTERSEPRDPADADLVFLDDGRRWLRLTEKSRRDNVSDGFRELTRRLGVHRAGLGFYTLRHVFRTVADGARDTVACDLMMGHSDPSMAAHYRERVEDGRLAAVAEHVRRWLFGPDVAADKQGETLRVFAG